MNQEHGHRLGDFQPLGDFQRSTYPTSRARRGAGDARPPSRTAAFTTARRLPGSAVQSVPGHPPVPARGGPPPTSGASPGRGRGGARRLGALARGALLSALLTGPVAAAQSTAPPINISGLPDPGLTEGATAVYHVVLPEAPTGYVDVLVDFASPLEALGDDVYNNVLWIIFDSGNWNVPRAVTIRAPHDDDGVDETATIRHAVYVGDLEGVIISETIAILDDEEPGVTFSPTGLTLAEGATATYTAVLDTEPVAGVTISPSSGKPAAARASGRLTFTAANWRTPQTLTVSGLRDVNGYDDTVTVTHAPTSTGRDYGALAVDDMEAVVTDVDAREITMSGIANGKLTLTEGATHAYTLVLTTQPSASVTVTPSPDDASVTASGSLTFTPTDWSAPQSVRLTAAGDDDALDDTVTVRHAVAGGDYADAGIAAADIVVTAVDIDEAGLTIKVSATSVSEAGGTVTQTVALDTRPGDAVTVRASSGNTSAATLGGVRQLEFTTANWSTPQTVTVTGVRDDNGYDDTATITYSARGGDYADVTDEAAVTVTDVDEPGLEFSVAELAMTERATAAYAVALATRPRSAVTVTPTSSDAAAATVSGALTFTAANWNTPQTLSATGVKDPDGYPNPVRLTHSAASDGADYSGTTAVLRATVADLDEAGVTLSSRNLAATEGATVSYTVALDTEPESPVTVVPSSSDASVTVTGELTFTLANWSAPQTVVLTAASDDDGRDEGATINHAISGGDYGDVTIGDVAVAVTDDDEQGFVFTPPAAGPSEDGGTATYGVALATRPTDPEGVTVPVRVQVLNESTGVLTMRPLLLLWFTTANWSVPKMVTVTGLPDDNGYDDTATIIHRGQGGDYSGLNGRVEITVVDNDEPGVTVSSEELVPAEGGTVSYTVALDTEPRGSVTVTPSSTNADAAGVGGALTFTVVNWAAPQTVTVSSREDDNGLDETATISHAATGGDYADVTVPSVTVRVDDADEPGVRVSLDNLELDEEESATYTVALETEPTQPTTVTPTVPASGAAAVSFTGNALVFTSDNWRAPKTVTVSGLRDDNGYPDEVRVTHALSGAAPEYDGHVVADVRVKVTDLDTAAITVSGLPDGTLTLAEGATHTYAVVLDTQPYSSVTVAPSSSDGTAVTASGALTFTVANWNVPQTVTLSGTSDDDGRDEGATINHAISGGDYGDVTIGDVVVAVTDDDEPGFVFTPPAAGPSEDGGTATYGVALATRPTDPEGVTVPVRVHVLNESTGVLTMRPLLLLRFTSANWSVPKMVTVTGLPDDNGYDDTATITHRGQGGDYSGLNGQVEITVVDNDEPGVTVSTEALSVTEEGSTTYTVVLDTRPVAEVTITPTSDNPATATVSAPLTFAPAAWNTPQAITVFGTADDDLLDQMATITHATTSADEGYRGMTVDDVTATVEDNDVPSVTASVETLTVPEDGTATYTVVLDYAPSGSVTVTPASGDASLATVSGALTFTRINWSQAQAATVSGVHRELEAFEDTVTITHDVSGGAYDGLAAGQVDEVVVTVDDIDVPSILLSRNETSVQEGRYRDYYLSHDVKLSVIPSADVTISIESSHPSSVIPRLPFVVIGPNNWKWWR